jgi:hypothetical protein
MIGKAQFGLAVLGILGALASGGADTRRLRRETAIFYSRLISHPGVGLKQKILE